MKETGGPAFPHLATEPMRIVVSNGQASSDVTLDALDVVARDGMTLRDYFAAKAMQAMLSEGAPYHPETAQEAYRMADLMLAERAK